VRRAVCVEYLSFRSPGQAPYRTKPACAQRAAYPDLRDLPHVVPHPESLAPQARYRLYCPGQLGIGVLPGPATGSRKQVTSSACSNLCWPTYLFLFHFTTVSPSNLTLLRTQSIFQCRLTRTRACCGLLCSVQMASLGPPRVMGRTCRGEEMVVQLVLLKTFFARAPLGEKQRTGIRRYLARRYLVQIWTTARTG